MRSKRRGLASPRVPRQPCAHVTRARGQVSTTFLYDPGYLSGDGTSIDPTLPLVMGAQLIMGALFGIVFVLAALFSLDSFAGGAWTKAAAQALRPLVAQQDDLRSVPRADRPA